MILPLVHYPDPRLRIKGKPVTAFDAALRKLAADMLETMEANEGVGLAAQQIGEALQFAIVDMRGIEERTLGMFIHGEPVDPDAHMPLYLINATVDGTKAKETDNEGCLSFPGIHVDVNRSKRVAVETFDLDGKPFKFEATGFLARAILHEFDHLQGRLFIDGLTPAERAKLKPELEAFEAEFAKTKS